MGLVTGQTDNRGISEIYGTVLIFALVFVTAVALVGVGFFVLNDTTTSANDRLAQDSVLELDDRLSSLNDDEVGNSVTWEVPQGTAEDFEADGDKGTINVTARTNDTYWTASRRVDGGLVDAATQFNSEKITLGTITHEGQDGVLTVYQGGGVLEVQDGSVTVLREPDVSVTDGHLVLDFVNISSVSAIDSSEIEATRGDDTAATQIQTLVNQAMQRDGEVVAPADINMTVTSRFADAWGKLIRQSVDGRSITVWNSDDLAELDDDQVRIGFGEFGDGIDLPSRSDPYGTDVIYTGIADLAPELYDDAIGEIDQDGDGFEVIDPPNSNDYTVGLRYDAGGGPNWWEWDPSVGQWVNIEDPTASNLAPTAPDAVTSVSGDAFEISDEAWTCVVKDSALRDHVDKSDEGCLVDPVSVDNPDDSVGEFRPLLEITDLDVTGPGDRQLDFGAEQLQVDVEVTNSGTAAADDGEPVGVLIDPTTRNAWVGNGTRLKGSDSLARGATREFSFTYTPTFVGEKFTVGAGTPDDSRFGGGQWEVVKTPNAEDFEIQSVSVLNGPVVEGDTLELDVRVYNNGSSVDTQDVIVSNAAGPQATEEYTISPGDTEKKEIEWDTEVGDGTPGPTTINITTLTDETSQQVNVQPASTTFANFQIQDVDIDTSVEEGNDLDAEVKIENIGGDDGTRTIRLRDQSNVIRATVNDLSLNSGQTTTLGTTGPPLTWETELGDAGVYDLTIETDDDSNTTTGVQVTPPPGANSFNVSIDESGLNNVIAGDALDVPVDIEYNGGGTRTESVWLANFDGKPVDAKSVTLTSGESVQKTLTWDTEAGDGQEDPGTITANSVSDTDSASVEVRPEDEAGPSYSIASFTTNSSTASDGSPPADPTVEGENLEISVDIENSGGVLGTENVVVEYVPEDRPIATTEVSVPSGGSTTVDLTWETVIGDNTTTEANPTNAENITIEIDGNTASDEIFIDERTTTRDPVDVMFAIDESGSMGTVKPNYGGDSWLLPPTRAALTGTGEVPGAYDFGSEVIQYGTEFWYVVENVDSRFDDGEILNPGETFSSGYDDYDDVWAGKILTNERTVPENADMWYVLPEEDGELNGVVRDGAYEDDEYRRPDGDFYVSGQTVDPSDYDGEAYVVELTTDSCESLCFDGDGSRYDAVLAALSSLEDGIGDRAGLLEFNTNKNVYQPITDSLSTVEESLRINPGGGTDITGAVFESQQQLNSNDEGNKKNIVLLTDGQHTATSLNPPPDERADEIDDDVTVYVVGFGNADTSEGGELDALADAGTGEGELFDGNEDSLEDIFADIGDELSEPDLPSVQVSTDDSYTVEEGNTLSVPVGVENTGEAGEQIITLTDIYGNIVDSTTVSLSAGETIDASDSGAPVLNWTADLQGSDTPPKSGELLVRTPDSEATPDVTVTTGPPSDFTVYIQNVTPADPQATDEIEVEVAIENLGDGGDTQTVLMRDDDGNPVDVKTVSLSGEDGPNDRTTAVFRWQTRSSDAGTGKTITVQSEDNGATETFDIDDAPGTNDEFTVDVMAVNDPITAGDALEVQIQAENVGSDAGKRFVELLDFNNRTVDLTETSELSPGGTETFNLTWNTEIGDGNTDDIYVVSRDDEVGQEVEVKPVTGPNSTFEVTSATTLTDPVTAGDDVEVETTIENTGTDADTQFVEAEFNGLTKTEKITVGPSSSQTVTFKFGTASGVVNSPTTFDVEVQTEDDNETTPVTIEPASGDVLTVDILSTSGPVEAGEKLDVTVEVDGLNAKSTLSLETPYGSVLRPADVESITSDGTYTITWSTLVGQGNSDPQEIVARVEGVTDTAQVTVEEAPEGDIVAPGTGPDASPVGIDIDEINMD
ncbi:DUF7289 family protein [Halovenus halobia]|uniref:DUF7289 family protein n=1 Tax=Halovenus halobia TaxID=3396622 RepID=UPI003F55D6E2